MTNAHFWTQRSVEGVTGWDPDLEPELHESGYGHSFLELFARMRQAGHAVTIGSSVPRDAACVVACLEELSEWHRQGIPRHNMALCRALMAGNPPLAVIRNDVHPYIRSPLCAALELMPSRASIDDPERQRCLPLMPQRGLVARDGSRVPRIASVGIKAFGDNLPEWVPMLERRLDEHDVHLRVDDGGTVAWGDFAGLDAVLCTQRAGSLGDPRRKPATKLVNAWAAGVIPICEPHPSYTELMRPDEDSILASGPDDVLAAILRVNREPATVEALLAASRRRGADFTVDRLVPQWASVLDGVEHRSRVSVAAEIVVSGTQATLGPRFSRRLVRALAR